MPEMDGYATASHLQRDPELRNIPLVFITALTDNDSQVKGLELGALDFITKPFNARILRHRIGNILDRESLRKSAVRREQVLAKALADQQVLSNTLDSAFNATNDYLVITDANFRVIKTNQKVGKLGKSVQTASFNHEWSRCSFNTLAGMSISWKQLAQRQEAVDGYLNLLDGQALPVSISIRQFDVDQGLSQYLFSITDISARLDFEKTQRMANEHLNDLVVELTTFKKALDAHALVSIADSQGRITYANDSFCEVSGFSREEILGNTHRIIKSGLHPADFFDELWQTIRAGKIWNGEIANRNRNGDVYWVDSTIVPWLDDQGIPYQYVAIRKEITQRIKAEQQVALARQRELETGSAIQQQLLFGHAPAEFPGLAVASFTEASQGIDGDFYTYTRLGPNTLEVLTGDVMGKGVTAALVGAGVKNSYRKVLAELMAARQDGRQPDPEEIINAIHRDLTPELVELDIFVTLALYRIDRQAMTVTWVNAGHTPGLLTTANAVEVIQLSGNNLPLGVIQSEVYQQSTRTLSIHDTILLYSDGVSESLCPQGNEYGIERIADILKVGQQKGMSPTIVLQSLRTDLLDHAQCGQSSDDRTVIILKVRQSRGKSRGTIKDRREPEYLELPRKLNKLDILRHRIAALAQDQPEERLNALELAAFEAATNVIRHTPEILKNTPFTAVLTRDSEEMGVELIYAGEPYQSDTPPNPDFSGQSEGGFGLYIIENSVDHVTYDRSMIGLASIRMSMRLSGVD
jgi:sigma-B regulation protein RsbU (phosphoserine phosphatase)